MYRSQGGSCAWLSPSPARVIYRDSPRRRPLTRVVRARITLANRDESHTTDRLPHRGLPLHPHARQQRRNASSSRVQIQPHQPLPSRNPLSARKGVKSLAGGVLHDDRGRDPAPTPVRHHMRRTIACSSVRVSVGALETRAHRAALSPTLTDDGGVGISCVACATGDDCRPSSFPSRKPS